MIINSTMTRYLNGSKFTTSGKRAVWTPVYRMSGTQYQHTTICANCGRPAALIGDLCFTCFNERQTSAHKYDPKCNCDDCEKMARWGRGKKK